MAALIFGSIGTLLDASELQREAFNRAFAEHGLDWSWRRDDYRDRLARAGGRDRIAEYAAERGQMLDPREVHATKTRLFQAMLAEGGHAPRPGVAASIRAAREAGHKVALASTTSPENVGAVLAAIAGEVPRAAFDLVLDRTDVAAAKPAPDAFSTALERLGVAPGAALAVEDNPDGLRSAAAAGVRTIAFPNVNTAALELEADEIVRGALDPERVLALLAR